MAEVLTSSTPGWLVLVALAMALPFAIGEVRARGKWGPIRCTLAGLVLFLASFEGSLIIARRVGINPPPAPRDDSAFRTCGYNPWTERETTPAEWDGLNGQAINKRTGEVVAGGTQMVCMPDGRLVLRAFPALRAEGGDFRRCKRFVD